MSLQKEGEFTLHGRAILEMEQFIRESYPDAVKICNICHGLLIQGQSCETCGIRMHLPCVAKYFQSTPEPRCPHCNDYWPHDIPGTCLPPPRVLMGWGGLVMGCLWDLCSKSGPQEHPWREG